VETNGHAIGLLGDPTRRAIFELLSERPSSVGDLAGLVPVSRPAVSQHLKVMKDAGLVLDDRDGTRRIYRLDPDGVAEMRAYLDRFWHLAMVGFKRRIEQRNEQRSEQRSEQRNEQRNEETR